MATSITTLLIISTSSIKCNGFSLATPSSRSSPPSQHPSPPPSPPPSQPSQPQRSSQNALVPRITLDEFLSSPIYNEPILIRDIATPETIESLADELMLILGGEEVPMQRKITHSSNSKSPKSPNTITEIYDIALQDTIDYMMDSSHDDSYFAFCEGLLPNKSIPETYPLHSKFNAMREAPFPHQENWFDSFPQEIQPTDAIILAGAGATSTLHRDPFEWTGTSVCLEGCKIWRFVVPPGEGEENEDGDGGVSVVDEAFDSYRLDSIAWEEDEDKYESKGEGERESNGIVLSAGWQSDLTLYETIDENFPTALEWVTLEEEDKEEFDRKLEHVGADWSFLRPSAAGQKALEKISSKKSNLGNDAPLFITAIQRPGDLLLIPAHFWHQTYAPVPSIAVASQRCGAKIDGRKVVDHVLALSSKEEEPLPELLQCQSFEEGMGKEVVSQLLNYVLF